MMFEGIFVCLTLDCYITRFYPCLSVIIADCVEANDLCGIYNNYQAKNPCRVCSTHGDSGRRKRSAREVVTVSLDAANSLFRSIGLKGKQVTSNDDDDDVNADDDDVANAEDDSNDDEDRIVEDDEDDEDYVEPAQKRKRKKAVADKRILRPSSSSSSSIVTPEMRCSELSINPGLLVCLLSILTVF